MDEGHGKMWLSKSISFFCFMIVIDFTSIESSFTTQYSISSELANSPLPLSHPHIQNAGPSGDISMITPYVSGADMASINEAFSSDASAPWGFIHRGIDFFPNGNLKPFRAVSAGEVKNVTLWRNDRSLNWQVNVLIQFELFHRLRL